MDDLELRPTPRLRQENPIVWRVRILLHGWKLEEVTGDNHLDAAEGLIAGANPATQEIEEIQGAPGDH